MPVNQIYGVDHGNGNMKTRNTVFPCGLVKTTNIPSSTFASDVIEYNGSYYVLSETRQAYKIDKTKDMDYFVLTLFAIAKEAASRNQTIFGKDIILSIGLPPGHFSMLETKMRKYIEENSRRGITFKYNSKTFQFYIKETIILPQNYTAIATLKSNLLKEYKTVYGVDIGEGTVDVLVIKNGMPDIRTCLSLEEGISRMRERISNAIAQDYGYTLDGDIIEQVLENRKTVLPSEVIEAIKVIAEEWTIELFNKLHTSVPDFRINPTVLMGGGSILLKEYLDKIELLGMKEYIGDIKANAIGYEIVAEKMQKAQEKQ